MHTITFKTRSVFMLFLLSITLLLATVSSDEAPPSCTAEQEKLQPCRCCKITCWYTIAAAATHELGHIPGQAGEDESLATLRLIRACMISECADVCPSRPRPPFLTKLQQ